LKYYGEDYDAISKVIGTKTVQQIQLMIADKKDKLKIDEVNVVLLHENV